MTDDRHSLHEIDAARHEEFAKQLPLMAHAAAFGEIISVLMSSPTHAEARLKDLALFVTPAVAARQYLLVKFAPKGRADASLPVGAAFWASVSDDIDARLRAAQDRPVLLTPEEWTSGPHLWLVDLVAAEPVRKALLADLSERVARGRPMTVKLRDASGAFSLTDLETLRASL